MSVLASSQFTPRTCPLPRPKDPSSPVHRGPYQEPGVLELRALQVPIPSSASSQAGSTQFQELKARATRAAHRRSLPLYSVCRTKQLEQGKGQALKKNAEVNDQRYAKSRTEAKAAPKAKEKSGGSGGIAAEVKEGLIRRTVTTARELALEALEDSGDSGDLSAVLAKAALAFLDVQASLEGLREEDFDTGRPIFSRKDHDASQARVTAAPTVEAVLLSLQDRTPGETAVTEHLAVLADIPAEAEALTKAPAEAESVLEFERLADSLDGGDIGDASAVNQVLRVDHQRWHNATHIGCIDSWEKVDDDEGQEQGQGDRLAERDENEDNDDESQQYVDQRRSKDDADKMDEKEQHLFEQVKENQLRTNSATTANADEAIGRFSCLETPREAAARRRREAADREMQRISAMTAMQQPGHRRPRATESTSPFARSEIPSGSQAVDWVCADDVRMSPREAVLRRKEEASLRMLQSLKEPQAEAMQESRQIGLRVREAQARAFLAPFATSADKSLSEMSQMPGLQSSLSTPSLPRNGRKRLMASELLELDACVVEVVEASSVAELPGHSILTPCKDSELGSSSTLVSFGPQGCDISCRSPPGVRRSLWAPEEVASC